MSEDKKHPDKTDTETGETPQGEPTGPEAEAAPVEPASENGRGHGRGVILVVTFLFLVVLALGGLGGWGWQQIQSELGGLQSRQSALEEQEAGQSEQLAALSTKVGAFNPEAAARQAVGEVEARLDRSLAELEARVSDLQGRLDAVDDAQGALEQRQASLDEAVGNISDLIGRTQQGWQLAEVEYLLGMAQRRLLLAQDLEGAIRALEAADERLRILADPALLSVREVIAREISALETYTLPDIDGMALRLKGFAENVESLPVAGEGQAPEGPARQAPAAEAGPALDDGTLLERARGVWSRFWSNMSHLVVVRHNRREVGSQTDEVDTLLTDRELHFQLLAARFALLDRDQAIFERRLGGALELLKAHYAMQDPRVENLVSELGEMREQARIEPDLPDVSGSLKALRAATAEGKGE